MNTEKDKDLLGFSVPDRQAEYSLTKSQKKAFDAMKSGKNLFICGPAGTGKSYLIDCFADYCRKNNKALMICAPTGMAAREIGGVTCHSAFRLDVHPIVNEKIGRPIKKLMEAEVILIDEISMVRIDLFESIIKKIQKANEKRREEAERYISASDADREKILSAKWKMNPIQLILVGDFFQLPPVLTKKDRNVLEGNLGYRCKLGNGYAFQSDYWRSYAGGFEIVRLTEIVRQNHDKPFTLALDRIRKGDANAAEYIAANTADHPIKDAIWLYGSRKDVLEENNIQLNYLPGTPRTYKMERKGHFGDSELSADIKLTLKIGARVMSIINDPHGNRYVNGSLGTVKNLLKDLVTVQFDNGEIVDIERFQWLVYAYEASNGKLVKILRGSYEQFPLKLAYAITIHKSQGQTFDKVNLSTRSFASGQLYVGLSRVRSVENMYIEGDISEENLLVNCEVARFDRDPKRYRFFKHAGGARSGAGRKPAKNRRGPTKQKRIPIKFEKQVDDFIDLLDAEDDSGCEVILVPAKFKKQVSEYIEALKEENK